MEDKELRNRIYNQALESCIPNNKDDIRVFFKSVLVRECDCIVFISRRCYILFQLYAVLEGWKYSNICTDLGIFARREMLMKSKSVLIVDDIGYTGKSIQDVSRRLAIYIPAGCRLDVMLYAVNKGYASDIYRMKIDGLKKLSIKAYLELTKRQCQELSAHLVAAILEAGIPYVTFVYSIWGKPKKIITENQKKLIAGYERSLFQEHKWSSSFLSLEQEKDIGWTNLISDYSCIRIYQEPEKNATYFLPFVFLKNIKAAKIKEWYSLIADLFELSHAKMVADKVREILSVGGTETGEALEYLSCAFSCFCSKSIAELLRLPQYVEEIEDRGISVFGDSFSEIFVSALKNCDEAFAKVFWNNFAKMKLQASDFFAETSNLNSSYFSALTHYLRKHADVSNVYEISYKVFEWVKSEESDKFFPEASNKFIKIEDMVWLMEKEFGFKREEIFLAQIECWDIGIATYRLRYDSEKGMMAICNAGEMSSVVNQLKFQKLIRKFYNTKYRQNGRVTDEMCHEIIKKIVMEESRKGQYTTKDLEEFSEIAEEDNYSFYNMLI